MHFNFRIGLFTLFSIFSGWALSGQSGEAFSLEAVLSAPFPTDLTAAPAGDRLAWVFNHNGVRNIWLTDAPGEEARPLTGYREDDGQEISDLVFSPDGDRLLFVRGGAPNRSGEIPNPVNAPVAATRDLWIIDAAGSAPRKLAAGYAPAVHPSENRVAFLQKGQVWIIDFETPGAEAAQLFQVRGSAGDLRWSPDGKRLAFVSNRGDHAFLGVYDLAKKTINYLSPSVDNDSDPAWSPDGRHIAWMRFPNEKQQLPFEPRREGLPWSVLTADLENNEADTLWTSPPGTGSAFRSVSASNQLFWSAGGSLVFPYEGKGWTQLWAVPATGGELRCLTPGDFEVQYVSMTPDRRHLLYSSNQGDIDRQHIWKVAVETGKPELLTPGNGIEWSPVATARNGIVGMLSSGGRTPAHPAWLDEEKELQSLAPGTIPAGFPADRLTEPEQVVFAAADGMNIHGQLFKPRDLKPGERRPAVLFFHGGSRRQMLLGFHHRGYYHNAYAFNQYLAGLGYIVLSVNYRSGIGYGMAFREALNYGARGASEYNDVLGAGLYLRGRADVDPDRIGLWGGSYGGYLTALGLARASDLFASGVDLHGVHDWNVVIRNFVPSYDPKAGDEAARLAYDSSPMAFIGNWRSPVLIIHGDDDRNVPFSESVDLAEALRRQGVYFEQLIFPDEVHGFLLHRNWMAAYTAAAGFFERTLKNKKDP